MFGNLQEYIEMISNALLWSQPVGTLFQLTDDVSGIPRRWITNQWEQVAKDMGMMVELYWSSDSKDQNR